MLTTDPAKKFGKITLQEHYDRIAVEGQEYDPYTHGIVLYLSRLLLFRKGLALARSEN